MVNCSTVSQAIVHSIVHKDLPYVCNFHCFWMYGGISGERGGLRGSGCDLKEKNVLHCKSLSSRSMNGGDAEDRSGAAIKKVSEERCTHTGKRKKKKRTQFAVLSGWYLLRGAKVLKVKDCVRLNSGAFALPENVGWFSKENTCKVCAWPPTMWGKFVSYFIFYPIN